MIGYTKHNHITPDEDNYLPVSAEVARMWNWALKEAGIGLPPSKWMLKSKILRSGASLSYQIGE